MADYKVRFDDDFSAAAREAAQAAKALKSDAAQAAQAMARFGQAARQGAGGATQAMTSMRGLSSSMRGSSSAASTWNANVAASVPQMNNLKRGVGGLSGAMNAKAAAANGAGGAMSGLGGKMGGMGARANVAGFAITALKVALAALAAAAVIVGVRMAIVLDSLGRSQVAFRNLAHGAGAGAKALRDTQDLAASLGLGVKQTTKNMQKLLAMQFDKATATELIKMGGALKALGNTQEDVDGVFTALSQIKAVGKLQGDELNQLAERGVSIDLVYKNLAERLGKTKAEVMKLKEAGKITADDAIAAIMEAVKDKGGVENFEDMAKQMGKTLPGKVDLLRSAWELFELRVAEMATGPLLKALGPILDEIIGTLKGASSSSFLSGVGDAFGFVGQVVATVWPLMKSFFRGLVDGLSLGGAAGPIFAALGSAIMSLLSSRQVTNALRVLGTVLGGIISIVGVLLTALVTVVTFIGQAVAGAFQALADIASFVVSALGSVSGAISGVGETIGLEAGGIGSAIIDGIISGIVSGASAVVSAITGVAGQAVQAAKDALKIKSPSQVFADIGHQVTKGFAKGVDPNAAANAMSQFATPPAVNAGSFAGMSTTTSNQTTISIAVDPGAAIAAAERAESPQEYAAAVRNMLAADLVDTLEMELAQLGAT